MDLYKVIVRPLITEKATSLKESGNQYVFQVSISANKYQITNAVEKIFKVQVTDIKTCRFRGKQRRVGKSIGKRPNWKKAYVTLKEGDRLQFIEGV